jgi:hypothetical protein
MNLVGVIALRYESGGPNWGEPTAKIKMAVFLSYGGGGGIRTPETLSGLTVFKTAGFNRSPTPPSSILPEKQAKEIRRANQKNLSRGCRHHAQIRFPRNTYQRVS